MQRKNSSRKTKKRAKPATKATRNWLIRNNSDSESFRIKEKGQAFACPFLNIFPYGFLMIFQQSPDAKIF